MPPVPLSRLTTVMQVTAVLGCLALSWLTLLFFTDSAGEQSPATDLALGWLSLGLNVRARVHLK
jgi:hypothetical protein